MSVLIRFLTLAISLLIFSCKSTTNLQLLKPAELNVGAVRTIAILDFDFTGDWDFSAGEKKAENLKEIGLKALKKAVNKDNKKLDPNTAYPGRQVADKLVSRLVQNGYYSVIEREKIDQVLQEQSLNLSGLVAEDQAVQIGQLLGAEALITASGNYSIKDEGEWQTIEKKKGKKEDVYKMKRNAQAGLTYRVINVSTGQILFSKTVNAVTRNQYKADGASEEEAAKKLTDWKIITNNLVSQILTQIEYQIAPHYVTEKREIEEGDSKKMETALKYAERGLWDDAANIWQATMENRKADKEDRIAATYNMGLYYELQGDLDSSEDMYNNAFKLSGDDKYLDARARIIKRKKELQRLETQGI